MNLLFATRFESRFVLFRLINVTHTQAFYLCGTGMVMVAAFLFTFVNPALCTNGCGNLTEPLFHFLYAALGPWGPRLLFFIAGIFFFWAAASAQD